MSREDEDNNVQILKWIMKDANTNFETSVLFQALGNSDFPVSNRKRIHEESSLNNFIERTTSSSWENSTLNYPSSSDESNEAESQDGSQSSKSTSEEKGHSPPQRKKRRTLTPEEKRERKREIDRRSARKKRFLEQRLAGELTDKISELSATNEELRDDSIKLMQAIQQVGAFVERNSPQFQISASAFPYTANILNIQEPATWSSISPTKSTHKHDWSDSQLYFELKTLRQAHMPSEYDTVSDDDEEDEFEPEELRQEDDLMDQLISVSLQQLKHMASDTPVKERVLLLVESLMMTPPLAGMPPLAELALEIQKRLFGQEVFDPQTLSSDDVIPNVA